MAKIYAYARCSLGEEYGQDLRRQTRELEAAGAEEIITEREHGDKEKAALNDLLERMEPQSTLIVCEVSRLARSTKMLCEIINIIKEKHLRLVILGSITVDCRNGEMDCMSVAFLQMAGVFSEVELQMTRSRVRSGLANCRARGVKLGRPRKTKNDIPAIFLKHYPALMEGRMNISELARVCGLSISLGDDTSAQILYDICNSTLYVINYHCHLSSMTNLLCFRCDCQTCFHYSKGGYLYLKSFFLTSSAGGFFALKQTTKTPLPECKGVFPIALKAEN